MNIINRVAPYVDKGGPGGWNDLDMLEVGQGGMTDDEYVAHFSMWAALKSPLLIGTDLRELTAPTLTILNNPAVIAVNQDPIGKAVSMVRQDFNVKKDKYGQGEIQVWSGPLFPNDQLVILFNAADDSTTMETDLNEIFLHEGPEGSAPQVKYEYDVYDLWADRMSDDQAQKILDGDESQFAEGWYHSIETSYQDGLASDDKRLLGRKIGNLSPENPQLEAEVPRHSLKMYRLRPIGDGPPRYQLQKQEL